MPQAKKKKAKAPSDNSYSKERLRIVFEYSPIAIWEEDFSALATLRTQLDKKKVKNIREYLTANKELVVSTFRKLKVLDVNQEALVLYGAKTKKELFDNLGKTVHPDAVRVLIEEFATLIEGNSIYEGEFKTRRLDGKLYDVKMRVSVPKMYKDSFKRVIVTFQDISVQKKYERHLKRLAQTDGLTKILNHRSIMYRLEEEFRRAKRYHLDLSCLMVDLDHFKGINDLCGHQKGDQVLKKSAEVLKDRLREVDIVGRYGGDEFFIILPETSKENAVIVANRLQQVFSDLAENKTLKSMFSTVSIGVGGRPSEGVNSAKALVGKVDKAMYAAKKAGRNTISVA